MEEDRVIQNQNPQLVEVKKMENFVRKVTKENSEWSSPPEQEDVFDILRYLPDPEHPFSLE